MENIKTVKLLGWKARIRSAWYALAVENAFVLGIDSEKNMGYSLRYISLEKLEVLRVNLNQATARLNHLCSKAKNAK